MAYTDFCKGCSISVRVSSEDIKNMIEDIISSKNFVLVSESAYTTRLIRCSGCKYLEYGTTCMQCGCIVQIRALMADKGCPMLSDNMW